MKILRVRNTILGGEAIGLRPTQELCGHDIFIIYNPVVLLAHSQHISYYKGQELNYRIGSTIPSGTPLMKI